jgi:hypothetical protein
VAKILAHMPIHIFMQAVVDAFLSIDRGSHEVNYLLSIFNPYPTLTDKQELKHISPGGRENIIYKMESARRIAITEGYDYLFNVEHDNLIPPHALVDLVSSGKDLISGIYRYRPSRKPDTPLMPEKTKGVCFKDEDLDTDVQSAHLIPWGCTLFSRKVFTQMPFTVGLDGDHTAQCEKMGIKRWVHTGARVSHVDMAEDGSMVEIKA